MRVQSGEQQALRLSAVVLSHWRAAELARLELLGRRGQNGLGYI